MSNIQYTYRRRSHEEPYRSKMVQNFDFLFFPFLDSLDQILTLHKKLSLNFEYFKRKSIYNFLKDRDFAFRGQSNSRIRIRPVWVFVLSRAWVSRQPHRSSNRLRWYGVDRGWVSLCSNCMFL